MSEIIGEAFLDDVTAFEEAVLAQRPTAPSTTTRATSPTRGARATTATTSRRAGAWRAATRR